MRILGIDPGTATTGWAIVESDKCQVTSVKNCDCILTEAKKSLDKRLVEIFDQLQKIIKKYRPDAMAIEELFFAKNTKTAISVGHARGVIMLVAAKLKIPVYEYTPLQVKQAVVGYGRADKNQVQQMLKHHLKTKHIPKQDDTADAIAVAITHIQTKKFQTLSSKP